MNNLPTPPIADPGPSQHQHGVSLIDTLVLDIIHSNSASTLNKHLKSFGAHETREAVLASLLSGGQDPLMMLDVHRNTLGYLYLISARLAYPPAPVPSLDIVCNFCRGFDPEQARLAPERITMLGKGIVRIAESGRMLKSAIQPLADLVTRYPPSPSYLTTIHPIFLHCCVSTRHFTAALPVLAHPITEISTQLSDLHYNDHLIYHYAGGMALTALKQWAEAEEFFELVVSSPAQAPAAIQMEALKKLTLVQLILYGKAKPLPKYTNSALPRLLKNTPYSLFTKMYPSDTENLLALAEKEEKLFATDKNIGLLKQALEHAPRWGLKKLIETYLTLSLAEVGREIRISDEDAVRSLVLSMIERAEIHASISNDGTVTFEEPMPTFTKGEIETALRAAQEQGFLLAELDREAGRSKDFMNKALKNVKDEIGWGGPADEDVYRSEKGGVWAEESLY